MLFLSFFKTLVDREVTVELKNGIELKGTLKTADQYFNLKLDNVSTNNEVKFPHLSSVKSIFLRGSTVRYVHISKTDVDTNLLQDAARRGMYNYVFYYRGILTKRIEALATSGKPIAGR